MIENIGVVLCLISGAVYSFAYDKIFTASDATGFIKWAWVGGITGENISGIVGAMITSAISGLLGMLATKIILCILTLFVGLYFFNKCYKMRNL